MQYAISVANGFCFGLGFILVAFVMKFIFHVGIMG